MVTELSSIFEDEAAAALQHAMLARQAAPSPDGAVQAGQRVAPDTACTFRKSSRRVRTASSNTLRRRLKNSENSSLVHQSSGGSLQDCSSKNLVFQHDKRVINTVSLIIYMATRHIIILLLVHSTHIVCLIIFASR